MDVVYLQAVPGGDISHQIAIIRGYARTYSEHAKVQEELLIYATFIAYGNLSGGDCICDPNFGAKESVASDPPGTIQTECVRLKVKGRDKNGAPFGLIA